jgi:hypothetical protein
MFTPPDYAALHPGYVGEIITFVHYSYSNWLCDALYVVGQNVNKRVGDLLRMPLSSPSS